MSDSSLGKFFKKLAGSFGGGSASPKEGSEDTKGKYTPTADEPMDTQFARQFTTHSGKFLYVQDETELFVGLHELSKEYNWELVYIHEPKIRSIADRSDVIWSPEEPESQDAFISSCEFLVAFNGGIIISNNQTDGKALSKLPKTHVVIGYTSQLVPKMGDAMRGMREKYGEDCPAGITALSGSVLEGDKEAALDFKQFKKDVFLFLVEDQV
jgi:L-lactate utilization protein LutC